MIRHKERADVIDPVDVALLEGGAPAIRIVCLITLFMAAVISGTSLLDLGTAPPGATLPLAAIVCCVLLALARGRTRLAVSVFSWSLIVLPFLAAFAFAGTKANALILVPIACMAGSSLLGPGTGKRMAIFASLGATLMLVADGRHWLPVIPDHPLWVVFLVFVGACWIATMLGGSGMARLREEAGRTRTLLERLTASEQRFGAFFSSSPVPSTMTRSDGRLADVNAAWSTLTGVSREAALGRTSLELGIWTSPEAAAVTIEGIRHAGFGSAVPATINAADGPREVHLYSQACRIDGETLFLSVLIDQTERLRAERAQQELNRQLQDQVAALRASETRYAAFFNVVPGYISLSRASDGTLLQVNRGFEETTGWTRDEVIGRTSIDIGLFGADDRERMVTTLRVNGGTAKGMEIDIRRKDGSVRQMLLSASLFELDDEWFGIAVMHDITDNKRQAAALERGYDLLERIQHLAGLGIWQWDLGRRKVMWSQTMSDIYQLDLEPRANLPRGFAGVVDADVVARRFHPEDRAITDAQARDAVLQPNSRSQIRIIRPDGSIRVLHTESANERDASGRVTSVFGFTSDITERVAAEQAIRASEQRFQTLFNSVPYSLAVSRLSDGVIADVNDEFERRMHLARSQVIGRTTTEIGVWLNPEQRTAFREQLQRHGKLAGFEYDTTIRGEERRMSLAAGIIELDGEAHVVSISRDITDERARELALRESVAAQRAAEVSNQLKSDFLAMISHEVRTPLGGVIGMLRSAGKDATLAADTREKLRIGLSNAEVLLQIINDILDFSKLEAGKMPIEQIDFDLPTTLRDIANLLNERAEGKGISLVVETDVHLPRWWQGDPTRLRQVLANLIGNAIKFTERGEVRVGLARAATGGIRLTVRDTGIGIGADALGRLFQKFEQADVSTSRKYGGTGLGLAICKLIVEAMHGSIEVDSQLGIGTTFTVRLPLHEGVPVSEQANERQAHARRLRILVAEDGATNQIVIRELLQGMGHTVQIAEDGLAALAALAVADFDLVLMDSRMPRLDGISALRRLRAGSDGVRQHLLPVVALTANATSEERERFLAAGADGFLAKPVDEGALHDEITRIIATQTKMQPHAAPDLAALDAMFGVGNEPPLALAPAVPAPAATGAAAPPRSGDTLRRAFLGEAPRLVRAIADAVAAGDCAAAALAAHSLKGAAGYLGADALRQLSAEIERQADANMLAPDAECLAKLAAEATAAVDVVRRQLTEKNTGDTPR